MRLQLFFGQIRQLATKFSVKKPKVMATNNSSPNSANNVTRAPPAAIDVVVVAGGRRDTASCVLVTTDYSSYLINCPEGAQRILTDIGGSKFSRLEHIFLTTNRWRNGGGLLGMALTLQTAGSKRLAIHGPSNCDKILTLARNFATENDDLRLEIEPCFSSESKDFETMFSDDSITVGRVPLFPIITSGSDSPKRARQSPPLDGETALAFVMKPKPKNRRVDMEKCVKLGLPRGPVIGQLVRGDTVTLPDGRVIKPDDILDDPLPVRPVLFVECPNDSYVKSLRENKVISQLVTSPNDDDCAQLVVHMSPLEVFESKRYQEWLGFFSLEKTDHLILNEKCPHIAHERIYRMQAQLNLLDPVIFKLLDDQLPENSAISNKSPLVEGVKRVQGGTGLVYQCRQGQFQPTFKGFPITLDNDEFQNEVTSNNKEFVESLSAYRELVKTDGKERSYPKVLFLGTASAVPGKRRNSSGILVANRNKDDKVRYILLDSAEGTAGQFLRYFGLGQSGDEALTSLDLVLLSHRHADHHMGFLGIVYERRRAFERLGIDYQPLVVAFPKYQIGNWLKGVSGAVDPHLLTRLIQVVEPERLNEPDYVNEAFIECLKSAGIAKVEAVPVRHCKNALGYHLMTESGFRLVFSGDTMPSDNLVNVGRYCDLLIHEATFDDDLAQEAAAKRHSTTSQAVETGRRMAAKMTVLTHFSQRYETLPHLTDELLSQKVPVGIAFDNMLISGRDDVALLPHMIPVLRHMFADKLEQLDEIKQKRSLKREREMAKLSSMVSGGNNNSNNSA